MPSSAQAGRTSLSGCRHPSEYSLWTAATAWTACAPTDRRCPGFGQAEVPDLALRDQLPDRARDVLYRRVRIDPVLVEQVDRVDAEARQGGIGGLPDELRPARKREPERRYLQPAGPQRPLLQGVIHACNRTTTQRLRERRFYAATASPAAPPDSTAALAPARS